VLASQMIYQAGAQSSVVGAQVQLEVADQISAPIEALFRECLQKNGNEIRHYMPLNGRGGR
jgi:hypothetical protein